MSKHYQATVYHQSKYFARHPPHLSPPMSAELGYTVERMCRLKGPLEPQWHCILYHRGVWWNCRVKVLCNPSWRYKQFEVSRRPKRSKDKRDHYVCGGISLVVIICDMRLLSCSIRALSVISYGSWNHFSLLIISQALAMKKSVYGLCTFKYALSFTMLLPVTDSGWLTIMGYSTYHISMLELHHSSRIYTRGTYKADFHFKHWALDGLLVSFAQWE